MSTIQSKQRLHDSERQYGRSRVKYAWFIPLGPWIGGSLLCQLKVPAMAVIDRDAWLQHGASGASRPSDVDYKVQQRQSMQAGGYGRGGYGNWTLGVWGSI
ncbi:hypothetical protein NXS19_007770 [Fusarium pseudograminearum]|nr:hypothetical protein NXS19_007770 [Fusarium pseudograminearum]